MKTTSKSTRAVSIPTLLAAAILMTGAPGAEAKKLKPGKAALISGVAGLAIGAAIADSHHHRKKKIYYETYVPPYPPGAYGPYFDRVFMPSPDVTCYPAQRMCYNNNGSIAGKWTYRVYGY